jgi:hypothetical protein
MVNENMFSNSIDGHFLNSSSPSDEFLELKDMEFHLGNDSTIWHFDAWDWKTPYPSDAENGATNDVFPIMGLLSSHMNWLGCCRRCNMNPLFGLNHLRSPTNSFKPEDDPLLLFDAPFTPQCSVMGLDRRIDFSAIWH